MQNRRTHPTFDKVVKHNGGLPLGPVTGEDRCMTTKQQSSRCMRILVAEKIEAQKKLCAEFGLDESQWTNTTQKELDYFWVTHCANYVLVQTGEGLKYVLFDSIEAKGRVQ